jgi:hypothetical protein
VPALFWRAARRFIALSLDRINAAQRDEEPQLGHSSGEKSIMHAARIAALPPQQAAAAAAAAGVPRAQRRPPASTEMVSACGCGCCAARTPIQ